MLFSFEGTFRREPACFPAHTGCDIGYAVISADKVFNPDHRLGLDQSPTHAVWCAGGIPDLRHDPLLPSPRQPKNQVFLQSEAISSQPPLRKPRYWIWN